MLAIRMQRTGRKGHAMFRVVVQDSRRTPSSGRVVAYVGSYDPHGKSVILQKDKISFYLENGAQPSDRVAKLLLGEGVTLPKWVKQVSADKKRAIRNPEKLRKNLPPETKPEVETAEKSGTEASTETAEQTSDPKTAAEPTPAETSET